MLPNGLLPKTFRLASFFVKSCPFRQKMFIFKRLLSLSLFFFYLLHHLCYWKPSLVLFLLFFLLYDFFLKVSFHFLFWIEHRLVEELSMSKVVCRDRFVKGKYSRLLETFPYPLQLVLSLDILRDLCPRNSYPKHPPRLRYIRNKLRLVPSSL